MRLFRLAARHVRPLCSITPLRKFTCGIEAFVNSTILESSQKAVLIHLIKDLETHKYREMRDLLDDEDSEIKAYSEDKDRIISEKDAEYKASKEHLLAIISRKESELESLKEEFESAVEVRNLMLAKLEPLMHKSRGKDPVRSYMGWFHSFQRISTVR